VPGVSSLFGALAYAGIPITDRRHSASFAVATGHKDPTRAARETRWDLLANAADTLVVLMGARNLGEIAGRLLAAGRSPATPAAVVVDGTLPAERARQAGVRAPAVIVVGEVARLRTELAWFERLPLFGRRVLVTRGEEQSSGLMEALLGAGAEPVSLPLIRFAPPEDPGPLDRALAHLADYDFVVWTSANAVRHAAERARERGVDLARCAATVACVGPATAAAARAAGLPVHLTSAGRGGAEDLLDLLRRFAPRGRRFLLPRSALARGTLPEGLRREGAEVDAVVAYRTLPAEVDAPALRAELRADRFAALTFTSPSCVRHFSALLDDPAREAARRAVRCAIGSVTAAALAEAALAADVVASEPGAHALVAALAAHVAGEDPAR
jgi:uroporphyrinogen III methyltransferase/synthase